MGVALVSSMKFWIFGIAFLVPSLIDMAVSWIDTFEWITKFQSSCNISSEKIHQTVIISPRVDDNLEEVVALISAIIFSWSILMTGVFSVVFFVGCLSHIQSKIKLKLLLEVSILVSLFGPVTNVNLLLRDCLTGYIVIGVSLLSYSAAIIVVAVTTEWGFTRFQHQYVYQVIVFTILTACKAVQIVSCSSTFGLFFGIASMNSLLSYTYLFFVIVQVVAMWTANVINRWKFYHLFFHKTLTTRCSVWPHLPRALLCVRGTDIAASVLNTFCCLVLLVLTVLFFAHGTLFVIAVTSLCISCLVSLYQLPWKHCCIAELTSDHEVTPIIGYD